MRRHTIQFQDSGCPSCTVRSIKQVQSVSVSSRYDRQGLLKRKFWLNQFIRSSPARTLCFSSLSWSSDRAASLGSNSGKVTQTQWLELFVEIMSYLVRVPSDGFVIRRRMWGNKTTQRCKRPPSARNPGILVKLRVVVGRDGWTVIKFMQDKRHIYWDFCQILREDWQRETSALTAPNSLTNKQQQHGVTTSDDLIQFNHHLHRTSRQPTFFYFMTWKSPS